MSWLGILGHDDVVERFRRALGRGRLASSFLFVGPPGIGKHMFAVRLAQSLLCQTRDERQLDPCGTCAGCVQVLAGTHPDVQVVAKPADKSFLPLELLIGDKEHRAREGLCHHLALRPFMGGRRVAVIDDADFLNPEGANCLLKTLEEPPPRSVLILIGTSPARQLPTIRSRCQLVRFRPLESETVCELLTATGLITDGELARRVAPSSEGSLQRAVELADPGLWEFRGRLYQSLAGALVDGVMLAKELSTYVEQAGREASLRRRRLRQVLGMAADFYRGLLGRLAGLPPGNDAELLRAVEQALAHGQVDVEPAAASLDRTLETADQVDRNANQSTLIESWADALAENVRRLALARRRAAR
jgi:DNA polymerase-3 subunit delta'